MKNAFSGILLVVIIWLLLPIHEANPPRCPLPSVQEVQSLINEQGMYELEIDGVAGPKTCEAWMMYSVGWEAENEKNLYNTKSKGE